MQTTTEKVATRPFHETIVEAIRRASDTDLLCLATLIKATKVPKGHNEIISAWNERRKALCWGDEDFDVPVSLLEQKQAGVKKSDDDRDRIDLNDLQQETEKLLTLLEDRQPGMTTWNEFVRERLQNLHKLASQALGK